MVAMHSIEKVRTSTPEWVFEQIKPVYNCAENDTFDEAVGVITNIEGWSVFKRRPTGNNTKAEYIGFIQRNNLWRFFHPHREKAVTRDEAR